MRDTQYIIKLAAKIANRQDRLEKMSDIEARLALEKQPELELEIENLRKDIDQFRLAVADRDRVIDELLTARTELRKVIAAANIRTQRNLELVKELVGKFHE